MAPVPIQSVGVRLGNALQALRKSRNVSQVELAALLGVEQNTVSRWETGKNVISLDDLERAEGALHLEKGSVLRRAGYVVENATAESMILSELPPDTAEIVLAAFRSAARLRDRRLDGPVLGLAAEGAEGRTPKVKRLATRPSPAVEDDPQL